MGGEYGVAASARRLGEGDRARAEALVGKRLPVTRFHTHDGKELDLEQLRGRRVLLIVLRGFTTQVCVYCFAQTAELVPLQKRFADLDTEVVVVYPGSRSRLEAFLQCCRSEFADGRPPYHMVYDPDLELSKALGITGNLARPSALILDREGVVRSAYVAESELNVADRPPAKELISRLEELSR
jgi:peroxiredoxin